MAILNDDQIKKVAIAGSIICRIFNMIGKMDLEGVKTIELDDMINGIIKDNNAEPAFLNYRGFPKSACISLNDEVVHGIPDERKIKKSDLVKVDVGVRYDGYIADAAKTFIVGKVDGASERLVKITRQALKKGIEQVHKGNRISDISRAVQKKVEENGFSVVRELTGHGVGANLHEDPVIPNFICAGPDPEIKAGMVLAIEPMVNAGGHEVFTEKNGWTIKTRDRSLSSHFEDTIVVLPMGRLNVTRVAEV
jgi:methionyl aminopeptidase